MRTVTIGTLLAILCLGSTVDLARAEEDAHHALALELARIVVDDASRQAMEDQITAGMMQGIGAMLQERLSRRLLESEWRTLAQIVHEFVGKTLGETRTLELTASVYMRHFEASELRDLLAFQRSALGQKAREKTPVVARETAEMIEREIQTSSAISGLLEDLRNEFPILEVPESP